MSTEHRGAQAKAAATSADGGICNEYLWPRTHECHQHRRTHARPGDRNPDALRGAEEHAHRRRHPPHYHQDAAVVLRGVAPRLWCHLVAARAQRGEAPPAAACIESIGHSKLYLLPIHDGPDASRALGDAATKSLEGDLAELKAEVESFLASPPERASTLVRRFDAFDAFDALRGRAQRYKTVLQVQVTDLDKTLDGLSASIETLLNAKYAG